MLATDTYTSTPTTSLGNAVEPCPDARPITELYYLFVHPSVELWASKNKSICILMKHFMFLFGSGLRDVSNWINKYVAQCSCERGQPHRIASASIIFSISGFVRKMKYSGQRCAVCSTVQWPAPPDRKKAHYR